MPNQVQTEEPPLSQMVADAYAKLAGDPAAQAKPAIDPTAQAYAGVPSTQALRRFDQLEAARGNTADSFAAVQPRAILPLFNPTTMPCRGMFSSLVPSALGNGQFALLQDVRIHDGSIMARLPTTNRSATGLPGLANSCRGLWSGRLNGTTFVVGGWFDGSKVGIYFSTDGTSFTAATQSSGAAYWGASTETGYASGDNRFHDYDVPLSFAVCTNKADGRDYLVIQDGTSAPRVLGTATLNGSYIRVIKQYSAPSWALSTQVTGFWRLGNLISPSNAANTLAQSLSLSSTVATITSYTKASPAVVTTGAAHGYNSGDLVLIAEATGTGAISVNGIFYAGSPTSNTLQLYYDQGLTNPVNTTSDGTYTPSSGTFRSSMPYITAGGFADLCFSKTAANGEGMVIDLGSNYNFSLGNQLIFSADQANYFLWNSFQVYVAPNSSGSPGSWSTVSDPTTAPWYAPAVQSWSGSAMDNATPAGGGLNGESLVGYPLGQLPASQTQNVRFVKLIWEGGAFTGTTWGSTGGNNILTLHLLTAGGPMAAYQSAFGVSYSGCGGLSESPGVNYPAVSGSSEQQIAFSGGRATMPYTSGFSYDHRITCQPPNLTDLQNGCDTVNVYAAQYAGNGQLGDYFFLFNDSTAQGEFTGGAWVYSSTASTTPPTIAPNYPFLAGSSTSDISRYMPDAYATVMPVGTCMASADGRSFVGGQGFYALSEYLQPFRFRQNLLFSNGSPVSRSASTVQLSGQSVKAFATPSGSALASSTVYFFTETKTYAAGGFDGFSLSRPSTVAEVGCSASGTVVQYKDAIFFLDDNRQQRRFGYGRSFLYGYTGANAYDLMPPISRRVVDDQTTGIPVSRLPWTHSVASFDKVYLAYSPAGTGANTKILVFDELLGAYVVDTLSEGCDGLVYADLSGGRTLLIAGAGGNVYTHEDPTSTAGHALRITSGETHDHMWQNRFYGRVGMVADVQSGQTATITKTLKPSLIDASTLDLSTSATGQVWRWDSRSTSTQPGLSGVSCQVDIQATMTPGTRIYGLVLETGGALSGADQL